MTLQQKEIAPEKSRIRFIGRPISNTIPKKYKCTELSNNKISLYVSTD